MKQNKQIYILPEFIRNKINLKNELRNEIIENETRIMVRWKLDEQCAKKVSENLIKGQVLNKWMSHS